MNTEGLFRVSGSALLLQALKKSYDGNYFKFNDFRNINIKIIMINNYNIIKHHHFEFPSIMAQYRIVHFLKKLNHESF